eukprot:CAMPEP_0197657216 /NCGR_PEP_ID=MMETSP1338-20131121/44495_1 /TAXON_ID=43686 ORGANISM="Pelagodinium beii, Strain RCC1491" /NCGR_SAMPLE_ID=MMETSP1338 /ASSEMBLY_ACC=CAM_ASM_000754 /LENGTH=110 /DNA_ID=CAMNT_0043233537 /DNA_START=88 /DNA_END=417 /DNA_ORIENTATION=-
MYVFVIASLVTHIGASHDASVMRRQASNGSRSTPEEGTDLTTDGSKVLEIHIDEHSGGAKEFMLRAVPSKSNADEKDEEDDGKPDDKHDAAKEAAAKTKSSESKDDEKDD